LQLGPEGSKRFVVAASFFRHQSLDTTAIYTHVARQDLAQAIEKAHPRAKALEETEGPPVGRTIALKRCLSLSCC
jgi:hypothetical protein